MLGVPSLARTSVHPTKRSLITRSKGIPRYNVYLAFRPSESLCQMHRLLKAIRLLLIMQNGTGATSCYVIFLTISLLCSFCMHTLVITISLYYLFCMHVLAATIFLLYLFCMHASWPAESSLHYKTVFVQRHHFHTNAQFTYTLNMVSSNSGRSNSIASVTSSSIYRFSSPSLKLFNTSQ